MGRSDDPFWSGPASPPAGGPDDFFGEPLPPTGYERAGGSLAGAGYPAPDDPLGLPPGPPVEPPGPPGPPGRYDGYDDDYDYDDGYDLEPEPAGVGGRSDRTPSGERRARPHSRKNLLWRWRRAFFVVGLLVMAMIAGAVAMVAQAELPDDPTLQQASFYCPAEVTENCNAQNAMVRVSSDEDRVLVRLDDVPQVLIDAVVSAEDRDFFSHRGVNPLGIGRALYQDLKGGGGLQGGSTITQQLVKNSYLGSERTVTRKLKEAMLSIKVEQSMSKNEILERYFNTIYFGRNAYGVQAASRVYFNKDVKDLKLPEAAFLAGLIRAPSLADPWKDPDEAARRRKTVLDAMLEEQYITQDEHDLTAATDLKTYVVEPEPYRLNKIMRAQGKGMEYISSYITDQLENEIGLTREEIALGGLRVYTTIDPHMQAAAWNAIYDPGTTDTPLNNADLPEGALVAIDDQGQVKAMVGGREPNGQGTFFAVRGMGSNGRPVGSTFKPIALAEAMQENYSLSADLPAPKEAEIPQNIRGCLEEWKPGNYNDSEYSTPTLDLVSATKVSSNTAYAELMYELSAQGSDTTNVRQMAQKLGMDPDELSNCLPIVLGASSSTPMEMAEVYSTFANQGVHKEPRVITRVERVDQDGSVEVLYTAQPDETPVLTPDQANKVTYALQQVVQGDGTGHDARLDNIPMAGKTGTTSSNKDAWFVGYTPHLTAAVWMGYPTNDWMDPDNIDPATGQPKIDPETGKPFVKEIPPMNREGRPVYDYPSITGGSMPAKIWKTFMQAVVTEPADFTPISQDQLQDGRSFEGIFQSTPETTVGTVPPDTTLPPDTQPTLPPVTPPTSGTTIPGTSVPDTSVPDTTEPPTTIGPFPTRPGGGGGGG